ncbi:DUF2306 domain-containing protein [Yoonia sediminilitoris]|uniref:Putative membrane protein DUF2306 n=1 Tax=Yoonia sediminilitoris TaxID=1286148 RepID=A0A2T6KPU1_9RHOB|nr:DUF2306 domain-containing protein [Yoonia sediminilitoris]PUB18583.1 putative membrane protein DUF2306 [Yoonia sediminilitoris]RCW98751.1 putative membrane protein DUF2306 [Yoonia sediminilitoris]
MKTRRATAYLQPALLLLAMLFAFPFVLYAVQFGQGGLRNALPEPHYIFSDNATANIGIFTHMITGALVTLLVPLQLFPSLRAKAPRWHRWSGRIIIMSALITAVGGLIYIGLRGTIGGTAMNIGFALYGVLILIAATQTVRHARSGRISAHHDWALRLFWLALGSWLYRVHYGLWYLATGGLWSNPQFTGGFDLAQNIGFYVPYLIGVELYLARKRRPVHRHP